MKLWPILLVVVALGTVVSCSMVARIDDGVAVDTPAHLNPSPADGDPRALAYVAPLEALRPTTTTTTAQPPRTHRKASGAVPGDVWDRLAQCESGGNWSIDAFHDGGLQFAVQTWASYAPADFPPYAYQATREQQIFVAERVLRDQGWRAWPVCSRKLGLR